jgi:hypothetical protein
MMATLSTVIIRLAAQSGQRGASSAIFAYVLKNKAIMPRTALRYAIEKMPKELKIKAMAR